MNIRSQIVIMSACLTYDNDINNLNRTMKMQKRLNEMNYVFNTALGYYKGDRENSFVVILKDNKCLDKLLTMATQEFSQECILYSDSNGETTLHFAEGSQRLGRLIETSKEIAEKQDSYTVLNGSYYITKE